jgi:biotin synthesis protein BioG
LKFNLLHNAKKSKLLLFFNGWGMDDTLFDHFAQSDFDVMTVSDYNSLEPLPELQNYSELHLAAWSLGVRVAAEFLGNAPYKFETATAFNGTLRPLDADFGIAPEIFAGTAKNWNNELARNRFYRRVAENSPFQLPQRDWESQQSELFFLGKHFLAKTPPNPFKTAWIGGRDRIIPAKNQRDFWAKESVKIKEYAEEPHFPFDKINSFEEIIHVGRN